MTKLHYEYPKIKLPDGDMRSRSISFNDDGEFVFEQTDLGYMTAKLAPNGGDSDYEYFITVPKDQLNRLLFELVKQNFNESGDFSTWLEAKKIKYDFFSY